MQHLHLISTDDITYEHLLLNWYIAQDTGLFESGSYETGGNWPVQDGNDEDAGKLPQDGQDVDSGFEPPELVLLESEPRDEHEHGRDQGQAAGEDRCKGSGIS